MITSTYIHIPFCKSICSYCDFCKMYYNESLASKYLDALEKEVKEKYKNEPQKTIYIGGGTPSSLSKANLTKLFKITSNIKLEKDYEFTIEANVNDIEESFLKKCKDNKVNRISIGIETINAKFYKLLNRYNNIEEIKEKIILCKKYFNNINIDLMYAFNHETIEDLKIDLDFFKELDVEHISIYSLILEKNTKLYIDKTEPIDTELESNMYYYIINYLSDIGYAHYEISNFSKRGFESKHNLNYWNNKNYYGFGLSASGYINDMRYTNTKSINNYINGNYMLESEQIDKKTMMEEELICGLRKAKGINIKEFNQKFNIDINEVFDIDKLIAKKDIIKDGDYIYIPENKLYISNNILINFII